jgi:hypothetical protein
MRIAQVPQKELLLIAKRPAADLRSKAVTHSKADTRRINATCLIRRGDPLREGMELAGDGCFAQ